MKKKPGSTIMLLACAITLLALVSNAYAQDIDLTDLEHLFPGLSDNERNTLLEKGELSHNISRDEGLFLVPDKDLEEKIASDLKSIDFTVGVEVVNIIPHPYTELSTIDIVNMLLEMSTLEGLEYYSESKEEMRTLFVQSYSVDNPEMKNRIDDPEFSNLPTSTLLTVFQEDTTFGKNINLITISADERIVHTTTVNGSTLKWGLVPIIRTGKMHLHVVVLRTKSFIVYYGNFGANAMRVNLFESRIHDSFYNRLVALYGWFEKKLDR